MNKKQQYKFNTEKISHNGCTILKCTRVDTGFVHYEVGELVLSSLRKARFVADEINRLEAKDKENGSI